jgi:PAS domain S-box-containing protein
LTLNDRLRRLRDPVEIQEVAVRLLGEHLRVNRVSYAEIDGDHFVVSRSYDNGVAPFAGRAPIAAFGEAFLESYRRGETVTVNDVERAAGFSDAERGFLLASQIAAFVGVMLRKEGRWLAAFGVHSATPREWTDEQIALIEETAERTWAAAQRARAEDALRRSDEQQALLLRLSDTIRPLRDPVKILAEACRLLGTHLHANRVAYGEIDGDECTVFDDYVDGVPSLAGRFRWTTLGGSRTEEILRGGVLVVNDTAADSLTASEREALQAAQIGAHLAPVLVKDGRFVAAFGIHSREPRVWTADEIALAQGVADRIWSVLEQRKAEAALEASQSRLEFLLRLNDALRPLSDPHDVQETAARLLGEHLQVNRVGYAEIEDREYVIRREYARGVAPLVGQGPLGTFGAALLDAYRRGETVVVNDVRTDPRFTDPERATMDGRQIAAFVGVTLLKGGRIVAAFGVNNATPRVWTPMDVEVIRDVAERTWDAVERTRAEAALREREQRLRLALEASGGGSWTWDVAASHVYWDDAFRLRYGFTPDEPAAHEAWLGRVHEEDRAQMVDLLEAIHRTTLDVWDMTYRIVRPDGTVAWIQSRGRADRDGNGQLTRLSGIDLDVTERRRIEEELQARRDEERDRELRLLLETAKQGIVSVDAHGTIVTANRAIEEMFGWGAGQLIGQSIERLLPSSLRALHARHRAGYFSSPYPRLMGGGLDLVGERKDGSTFPIEVSLNHVVGPGGAHAFAFVTDITERKRVASALQERTAELERRTAQLSQLASDLTLAEQHAREQLARTLHDGLQQLLVVAALNLDQHVKRHEQGAAAQIDLIVQAKNHLAEAIKAARVLSFELYPPMLHSSGLPGALTWLADWTRNKYGLDVRVSADPAADSRRKDVRTLLFESVRELLLNVVKHAQVDNVTVNLEVAAGGMLAITVRDEGVGFDAARLADRAKAAQVGWGLFSIRERLTLLGGQFEIDSAPGEGTRFRLIAPRGGRESTTDRSHHAARAAMSRTARGEALSRVLTLLVVDDHAAVRKTLCEILQQRAELSVVGHATNGVEAIAQAHALRPDVVLMDVSMPVMDGVEATRRLRAELPSIQVLGLSMQPRNEHPHSIEHAGAAGFFTKGADMDRLIEHLLRMHAARSRTMPNQPA